MKRINFKRSLVTAAAGATFLAFSTVHSLSPSFTIELIPTSQFAPAKLIGLNLDSIDSKTGDFSGEAINEQNRNEVWEVVGTVLGDKVEIEFTSLRAGERIVASGKVDKDGLIIGKAATEDGELFEWETQDAIVAKDQA